VNSSCSILRHQTASRILWIEKFDGRIPIDEVTSDQDAFNALCQGGCRNYGSKYSCPPFSPGFLQFSRQASQLEIFCYRLSLVQFSPIAIYSRIRAGNSVLKSIVDRDLYDFKARGFKVAGSGSCRACKICGAKIGVPCKKPDRRIYSLEALGVNVDKLVVGLFGFRLEWYLPGRDVPDYTCTVGAVFS
jgi:predicted metal-binding protein